MEKVEVVGRTAALGAIGTASLAGHRLAGEGPGIVELEARIERGDAIVTAGELAIGDQEAQVRFAEFALHADHADFGAAAVVGIGGIECRTGGAVVDGQHPDVPLAQFAGNAAAEFGIDDAARKEEVLRRCEIAIVFEKKRAFFGKNDFEALIDGDRRIVRFHLAEVGI